MTAVNCEESVADKPVRSAASPDVLSGGVQRTLLWLALPVLAQQFLNFCVGFYDVYLAGNLPTSISLDATSAVGLGAYVGWLASLLFSVVAAGTTALVSRARGAGLHDEANRVANRSIALGAAVGVIFCVSLYPLAPILADLLAMTGDQRDITIRYLRWDALGYILTATTLAGVAALQGSGDTRTPMWILGTVSVVNIIVSWSLVHGAGPLPRLGVDGIVLGTVAARSCGGVVVLAVLWVGRSGLVLKPHELRIRGKTVRRILSIGVPAAVEGLLMWGGHFIFLRIVNTVGPVAFAAHIIGVRVEAITYLPAVAWGTATATLVGQSLGAENVERARHSGYAAAAQCGLFGLALTAIFFFGSDVIYRILHNDPAVREMGGEAFKLVALFQIPLALGIVAGSALRGAGDVRVPMWITGFTSLLIRLPAAWVFGVLLGGGLIGVWIGMCADMLLRGTLLSLRFVSGKWAGIKI